MIAHRNADPARGGSKLYVEFRSDVFDRSTVVSLTGRLQRLLEAVAAHPDRRIGAVDLLEPSERKRLLVEWNNTTDPDQSPEAVSVPELFARQVERVPEATAVLFGDQSLTYAELDAESNRLARLLISEGVGPEQITALALPRSIDMIVAILAVLKAGGAYLPIDPHHPAERVEFMLHDAAPALAFTTTALRSTFRSAPRRRRSTTHTRATHDLAEQDPVPHHRQIPDKAPHPAQPGVRDLHLRLHRHPQGRGHAQCRAHKPAGPARCRIPWERRYAYCSVHSYLLRLLG